MSVKAAIAITQFSINSGSGSARESIISASSAASIRESLLGVSSWSMQTHQPAVTQPAASTVTGGWPTRAPERDYWSDSPVHQPNLLYRLRYSFGRDVKELFAQPARPGQDALGIVSGDGTRWGKLDANSGILQYERPFTNTATVNVLEFWVYSSGNIREVIHPISNNSNVKELGPVTGEATVHEYPFLLSALPIPGSVKNPISTDVYIRVGNFTSIFDPDSFVLYLDGVLQTGVVVDEFFGGLGGFDVTWSNAFLFDYDTQVVVRWEFRDLDIPANQFVIQYSFFTVPDSAGPRVTNLIPANGAIDIPVKSTIQFDLEDYESDVDVSSLQLYVNNIRAVDGETGTLELVRFQNEKGYTVKYTHEEAWLHGDLIPIALFIKDTSKSSNETFYTYSFTTSESIAPRMINLRPLVCAVAIPTGTHISVDVVDGGHGLNKDSIVFTVEDIERSGQIALIPIVHRDE